MTVKTCIAVSLWVLLSACGGGPVEEAAAPTSHDGAVAWFEGTVEEAFTLAAEDDRPIFLYWGAVWCPPCHYLKNKVFSRPEFVERSTNFVMVYLDGDSERAQVYGERFGTTGYPTVIIFGADGEERMRMPTSVEPALYGELLDEAMTMRPIGEVLTAVRESGAADAPAADLHLLAFYSWGQDRALDLPGEELLEIFGDLYRDMPADLRVERSRFLGLYLEQLIEQRDAAEERAAAEGGANVAAPTDDVLADGSLAEGERAELEQAVLELLTDRDLLLANLSFLFYGSTETVSLLEPESSLAKGALAAAWDNAARAVAADETLPIDDRLSSLLPRLNLAEAAAETPVAVGEEVPEVELPVELVDEVRDRVAWAVGATADAGELQAVLSTAGYLLEKAGLAEEAEALLIEQMAETRAPWYFMGWVGGLKEDAGDPEEALAWYRKAHDNAEGRYTRFRWGSSYLRHLIDLTPDDEVTIAADSEQILAELLTLSDAFAHGNHSRLRQLDKAYREWNQDEAHTEVVDSLRDQVHAACEGFPAEGEDSQAQRCRNFLTTEEEA